MKEKFMSFMQSSNKVVPLPILILSICSVVLCSLMYIQTLETNRLLSNFSTTIPSSQTPLASNTISAGDTITIRVSAQQVTDMYGYQFKLNYDQSVLQYKTPRSLNDITTIFAKEFEGYVLVGATKVGQSEGLTASNTDVCEIVMTVLKDGPVSGISLSEVNVVDSTLNYDEGVNGWTFEIFV